MRLPIIFALKTKKPTTRQVADLLGHTISEITKTYYVKRDMTKLNGITDGFEFKIVTAIKTSDLRKLKSDVNFCYAVNKEYHCIYII
jgi:hypothetical protein